MATIGMVLVATDKAMNHDDKSRELATLLGRHSIRPGPCGQPQ